MYVDLSTPYNLPPTPSFSSTISPIMRLYNTLTRKVEDFQPYDKNVVKMYCCGPTVYDYPQIGNLRKYVMDDVIKRTLKYLGYDVNHVMNITDVGHLTDDADAGEDKLEKGAKRTGKTVWEVAKYYTDYFDHSMKLMNVEAPTTTCKATDHIKQMIKMVSQLEQRGYTYETCEAVYFDVSKDKDYGILTGQKVEDKKVAVRSDVHEDKDKKHPADFALWFKRVGRFADHTMHWSSPWGDGFPGWHIECSAMSTEYLGNKIDIHTGGIDHIPVHHTNEIAQSECATGEKPFVKCWIHHNFLTVESQKMSKSLGNFLTIDDVVAKGFDPIALRLLFLQSHYRSEMNFTWDALKASQKYLIGLLMQYIKLSEETYDGTQGNAEKSEDDYIRHYRDEFKAALTEDINTPRALAVISKLASEPYVRDRVMRMLFDEFGSVLGLSFARLADNLKVATSQIPDEVLDLAEKRKSAKLSRDYTKADEYRKMISDLGYEVKDVKNGEYILTKK